MTEIKPWLTVAEAAFLVGRHPKNVYRWIESGQLQAKQGSDRVTVVRASDAQRIASVTKRGRPRGSASTR